MERIASAHHHALSFTQTGVNLVVTIAGCGGDPALARDFADQLAGVVEDYVRVTWLANPDDVAAEPAASILHFPVAGGN